MLSISAASEWFRAAPTARHGIAGSRANDITNASTRGDGAKIGHMRIISQRFSLLEQPEMNESELNGNGGGDDEAETRSQRI
jgi:hypothetical protein